MSYMVGSEVGRLEQVILHRPGREMDRLTPSNKDSLLFDDIMWLEKAQEEHDAFAQTLRDRGAEVLYLQELLAQTIKIPDAREYVLKAVIDERVFGPDGVAALRGYTDSLTEEALAEFLIAGITKRELLELMPEPNSMDTKFMSLDECVLNPLPNSYFTRDTSCWVYNGVSINSMAKPARMRETVSYEAIYRWHPAFASAGFPIWSPGTAEGRATIEGGDVEIIGNGAIMVGMSERTAPMGVERMARKLFAQGAAEQVVAVQMPKDRAQMHLDTVMTMLDPETFVRYPLFGNRQTWILRPEDNGGVNMEEHGPDDFESVIAQALGLSKIRVLTPPQTAIESERDQWNDGFNVLAVAPGVVVGYERNVVTTSFMRKNGIEVLDVPGAELGRGRGGPRCMSCPTRRAAL